MKHLIYIFAGLICCLITLPQVGASPLENKKQRFRITVLNTGGEPQQGIILKVAGYSSEYISNEQGLIDFEQSIDNNYVRTANFYFPTDKNRTIKSLRLDEAAQDTIIRIDRPEDLARFKQSGKTLLVNGVLKEGGKPVPHAEISIQGTGKHTFSNAQGEFSIEADYSHLIMIRAERMENKYLDIESFLQNPNQPLEIRMTKKGADRVYHVVEKMPEYPGGMKAFFNYIRRKAHTTELAEETQKEGAVMIPHAEISIQGTGKHTFSNAQGEFSIEADYSHLIMIRAERMENKYLDIESFLQNPNQPLEIRMTKKGADRVYHVVEKMPEYPGGMKAFFNYIRRKAHTTELAEETQKEGAVMIQFIVEKDGSITSPSIVRGLDARLDTAALDAIIVMPDWIPAQEHGINVRCKYSVPVPFKKPKPTPPVAPKSTPDIKKDSLSVPSAPADSLAEDSVLQVIPMPSVDSLMTDTLATDTTLVVSTDSTSVQKETVAPLSTSEATEVKPKKRNFLVRFFRWLFGIKDKENTPAESKEEKTSEVVPEGAIQKEE